MVWKGFRDVQATIEIDTTKSLEELWKNLDKDARWGVNKAKKEGLTVTEATENDVSELYNLYESMSKHEKIKCLSFNDFKKGKIGVNKERILVCKKDGKVIAGILIVEDKQYNKVWLHINASNPEFLKFQPNNILYWHMIEYGKNNGFSVVDLGGYQLNAKPESKLYEVNRFKERWGGKIITYYIYSKNPLYILGRKIIRNFPLAKKLKDKIFS